MIPADRLSALKKLASPSSLDEFAADLTECLQVSFAQTMEFMLTQKLLMKFRSIEAVQSLRSRILAVPLLLGTDERADLLNHFDVCEFVQSAFALIDERTASLGLSSIHPDIVAMSVLHSLEAHLVAVERGFIASLPASDHVRHLDDMLPRMSVVNRSLREAQDAALLILNAPLSKEGTVRGLQIEEGQFMELVELAGEYDFVRTAFDQYSYHGFSGRTQRRSLVLRRDDDDQRDLCWIYAAHRMANDDQARRLPFALREGELRESLRQQGMERDFWAFYENPSNAESVRQAKLIRDGIRSHIEQAVSKHFDLSASFRTQHGSFTFAQVIRGWSVIYGAANLARIRNLASPEDDRHWPFLISASHERLLGLMREEFSSEPGTPEQIVAQFTSRVASTSHIDLFYRPLLQLTTDEYVIAPSFVTASRFDRNVFTIAVTESDLNQKEKGSVPVRRAVEEFRAANFKAISDFAATVGGCVVTDIDIAAYKHGHLFLGQAKVVIDPDSLYDRWKVLGKLGTAAGQLDETLRNLPSFVDELMSRLGISERPAVVVPFIITSSWQFTGIRVSSYPVIDFDHLTFLLTGARLISIQASRKEVIIDDAESYIKGRLPTGAELERLILDPIPKEKIPEGVRRLKLRKIGPYKIHVPYFEMEV